nr:DUF6020 family protein [Microbacterium sp. ZXX196]
MFGWSDAFAVGFAACVQLLTTSAAFTFVLVRIAAWGAPRWVWVASATWLALLPQISIASVSVLKDTPFMSAFVVYAVALVEILKPARPRPARWPWAVFLVAGIALCALRSNGVYVVFLSLIVLAIAYRRHWKGFAAVFVATAIVWALVVGPFYRAVGMQPGPPTEAYSLPLQQLARIAGEHQGELTPADVAFLDDVFADRGAERIGNAYNPSVSDPVKADARENWDDRSMSEFLVGWWGLVERFPGSAVTATLANTAGWWSPNGISPHTMMRYHTNDVPSRGLSLDIPANDEPSGLRGLNTRVNFFGGAYQDVPVLSSLMSAGFVAWLWVIAAVILIRRRDGRGLGVVIPTALMWLTFFAGPVSGNTRYALAYMAAFPIVAAIAAGRTAPVAEVSARDA